MEYQSPVRKGSSRSTTRSLTEALPSTLISSDADSGGPGSTARCTSTVFRERIDRPCCDRTVAKG